MIAVTKTSRMDNMSLEEMKRHEIWVLECEMREALTWCDYEKQWSIEKKLAPLYLDYNLYLAKLAESTNERL